MVLAAAALGKAAGSVAVAAEALVALTDQEEAHMAVLEAASLEGVVTEVASEAAPVGQAVEDMAAEAADMAVNSADVQGH